ncbi:MAG TPA: chemotaxis protein CheB [Candidatus Binatus sp.]|nr:chemotaxis protein CheB [Candidatus Binatus sp.]
MTPRDIVVIGASAGGVTALMELASGLPREFPAALFVVVHSSPDSPGFLPEIVSRAGPLPAAHAVDGERFSHGRFYIAPPDRHLLVEDGTVRVTRGPSENGFRPAVDPLFRTAARSHGARVVGVVLSGALDDGSQGLQVIKDLGGVAIAQHPDDALIPSMPRGAIRNVGVDHVLPVREMAAVITRLASEPVPEGTHAMSRRGPRKTDTTEEPPSLQEETPRGPLSPFTCPECGGTLWETRAPRRAARRR